MDNEIFQLQIWDSIGYPKFNNYMKPFYQQAQGIILVYDCTREESLMAAKNICSLVNQYASENTKRVVVGNKCDREDKTVENWKGEELAQELHSRFFETSAKDDINVSEMFDYLSMKSKTAYILLEKMLKD